MFDRFSLPDLAAVARRTALGAVVVGVLGLVVLALLGQFWAALGLCLGIAIGLSNFRLAQRSVAHVSQRAAANKRRPLAMNTFSRMVVVTVVALGLLFVEPALAFGLLGGLAVFQVLLLANVTRSMLKMGSTGGGIAALDMPDDGDGQP